MNKCVCLHKSHCQKGAVTDHFKVFNSQPHRTWFLNLLLVYMNKADTFEKYLWFIEHVFSDGFVAGPEGARQTVWKQENCKCHPQYICIQVCVCLDKSWRQECVGVQSVCFITYLSFLLFKLVWILQTSITVTLTVKSSIVLGCPFQIRCPFTFYKINYLHTIFSTIIVGRGCSSFFWNFQRIQVTLCAILWLFISSTIYFNVHYYVLM